MHHSSDICLIIRYSFLSPSAIACKLRNLVSSHENERNIRSRSTERSMLGAERRADREMGRLKTGRWLVGYQKAESPAATLHLSARLLSFLFQPPSNQPANQQHHHLQSPTINPSHPSNPANRLGQLTTKHTPSDKGLRHPLDINLPHPGDAMTTVTSATCEAAVLSCEVFAFLHFTIIQES